MITARPAFRRGTLGISRHIGHTIDRGTPDYHSVVDEGVCCVRITRGAPGKHTFLYGMFQGQDKKAGMPSKSAEVLRVKGLKASDGKKTIALPS